MIELRLRTPSVMMLCCCRRPQPPDSRPGELDAGGVLRLAPRGRTALASQRLAALAKADDARRHNFSVCFESKATTV
eukprot:3345319-Prymnesium_polylepis.1